MHQWMQNARLSSCSLCTTLNLTSAGSGSSIEWRFSQVKFVSGLDQAWMYTTYWTVVLVSKLEPVELRNISSKAVWPERVSEVHWFPWMNYSTYCWILESSCSKLMDIMLNSSACLFLAINFLSFYFSNILFLGFQCVVEKAEGANLMPWWNYACNRMWRTQLWESNISLGFVCHLHKNVF